MNKVIIIGNLTRNPELKHSKNGTAVTGITIANNRKYKEKQKTIFIDAVAFGKTAEFINNYFTKGTPILVEGHLTLDSWVGKDGIKRQKHKIVIEKAEFTGAKRQESDKGVKTDETKPEFYNSGENIAQPADNYETDEDIPF
jgi:single-strand DNA-binding protein